MQVGHQRRILGRDGKLDLQRLAGTHDGEGQLAVLGHLLNHVAKTHAQILVDLDHALIVDGCIADAREHIPFLERIRRIGFVGPMHHHSFHALVQLQIFAQRRILQRLQVIVHAGLADIVAAGDILEE